MNDTICMTKGEVVSLSKKAPGLTRIFVGAGWDMKKEGVSMDLDLAAFLLDSNDQLHGKGSFVYFGNKASADGSTASRGDNLTGAGEGDDEVVDVDLSKVSPDVTKIRFVASIYLGKAKGQSLKDLDNAFIRIVNVADNAELANYKITDTDSSHETFILGELVRDGSDWSFRAIGEADAGELGALATRFGLQVAA